MNNDLSKLSIKEKGSSPDTTIRLKVYVFIGALLIGSSILFLFRRSSPPSPQSTPPPTQASSSTQATTKADAGSESVTTSTTSGLVATGYVVAQRTASVSSKATGRLREVRIEEGDQVVQGQVLAILENEDLVAAVHEQEAALLLLDAQKDSVAAEFEDARRSKARFSSLWDQGVVTREEYDRALLRFDQGAAGMKEVAANKKVAEARLARTRIELEYAYIKAPFAGTVISKSAQEGEVVAPFGSSADARGSVAVLADMKSLEIEADVSESNLSKIFVGQRCTIQLDSIPDREFQGEVKKIIPTVDRAKATVQVKIGFLDEAKGVIPEMSTKIRFATQ